MIIKFSCDNGHWFTKTDIELREEKHSQRFCNICGEKLHIEQQDLDNILIQDVKEQVKKYFTNWSKKLGIEGAIELIERNKNSVSEQIYNLYKTEIESRGFKIC